MSTPGQSRALTQLAPALRPHLAELVDRTLKRITTSIDSYRDEATMTVEELRSIIERNFVYLLECDPDTEDSATSPPRETGRLHARRGIPLPDALSAYRIGFALLWDTITHELLENHIVGTGEVIDAASELWWRADHFGQDVTSAYRDATTELLLRQEHERSAMVEALVTGTIVEQPTLWETASRLDIPHTGHFAVVVAAAEPLGTDPLPGLTTSLAAIEVASAWRLAPHQAVGILSLPTPDLTRAVERIEDHASGHVGMSSLFDRLEATPRAYYLAGVALRSKPRPHRRLRCFDDTPIAVLVAASPDAATAIAQNVLGPVLELPEHDRNTLLDTFEAWLRNAGSINDTARELYCHPNTVRYRLRKLVEYTGRPVEDPAATSELNAALQAWRLVGHDMNYPNSQPR
jgi:hypothetical protein